MGRTSSIRKIESFVIPISAKTNWIFIVTETADGVRGYGEATWSGTEEAVLAEIGHARVLIENRSLTGPAEIAAALHMADMALPRRVVLSALEQATFDSFARRAGVPMSLILGGPARRSVPVYANINRGIPDRSPKGFGERAQAVCREDGYRAIKIAPFDGLHWTRADGTDASKLLETGLARIAAVREAVGPDVALLVDCHSRLSPIQARTVLRETAGARLFWLEDALDEKIFDGETLRSLRSAANDRGVRIAGGENLSTLAQMRSFLALGGCDAILPDLRLTGIRTGMNMLALAVDSGVEASLHNPVGPVLDLVSLQVASALPSCLVLERQVRESPLFDEIRGGAVALTEGRLTLPPTPGIGCDPDRAVLARHATSELKRSASFAGMAGAGPNG